MRFRNYAVDVGFDQFLGAAGVRHNHRHSRSLRLDDNSAEGLGGAGENKNIGGSMGGSGFFAARITGEDCLGHRLMRRLRLGAVTDAVELNAQSLVTQSAL